MNIFRCFFCGRYLTKPEVFEPDGFPYTHNKCFNKAFRDEWGPDYTAKDYARDHIIDVDIPVLKISSVARAKEPKI